MSLPNRNIDYPALSLPTLMGCLKRHGITSRQKDLNIVIRDKLITEDCLEALCQKILPHLICNYSNNLKLLKYFVKLHSFLLKLKQAHSFDTIENVKKLLQDRKYKEVFEFDSTLSTIALSIFKLNRFLHNLLDFYAIYPNIFTELGIADPIREIVKKEITSIMSEKPLVVGFSVLEIQKAFTKFFISELKQCYDGKILIGGAEASRYGKDYFTVMGDADFLIRKDAECNLPMLIKELKSSSPNYRFIPGLCYKTDKEIIENETEHITASDICLPDFIGIDVKLFLTPILPIHASRACYWASLSNKGGCDFCVHHKTYSSFCQRTATSVVNDMKNLYDAYATNLFHLTDDALPPILACSLSEELIKLKRENPRYDFKWTVYCRFEKNFDHSLLKLMYDAGARIIEWGLETASQKTLREMNKGIEISDVKEIINIASDVGILNKLFCFHNYPTETIGDLYETLDFLRKLTAESKIRPFSSIKNKMYLLKGSDLYDDEEKRKMFCKIWNPSATLNITAEYEDNKIYPQKTRAIEKHLEEISKLMKANKIFSSDDDIVMLDMVLISLHESGINTQLNIKVPQL